jgi:hypothetical protein
MTNAVAIIALEVRAVSRPINAVLATLLMTTLCIDTATAQYAPPAQPNVVRYEPPAVPTRAYQGITLELFGSLATTSIQTSTGGGGFAFGVWLTPQLAIAFRLHESDDIGLLGAAGQYRVTDRAWLGAEIGRMSEDVETRDRFGFPDIEVFYGIGGSFRAGYNLLQSGRHAVYASGEIAGGVIENNTRVVGTLSLGYQLL